MASDAPLVLWDCIFPHEEEVLTTEERVHGYEDRLEWVYVGEEGAVELKSKGKGKTGDQNNMGRGKWGRGGVVDDVWEMWRGNKIDEVLSGLLVDRIAEGGKATLNDAGEGTVGMVRTGPRVFDGSNCGKAKGGYVPVLQRERMEAVEVVNERYLRRRGGGGGRAKAKAEDRDGDE
jgi:tRNA pseudouridine38/39 synthase